MVASASKKAAGKAGTTASRKARVRDEAIEEVVDEAIQAAVRVMAPAAVCDPSPVGKQKLVRDSFTMPKDEYEALDVLKKRLSRASRLVKKGELLRAGVRALSLMPDEDLVAAVSRIPSLKTGRPKNAKAANDKSSNRDH